MDTKAQPPQAPKRRAPDPDSAIIAGATDDEILNWLGTLPEGAPKEREKRRLLEGRFRKYQALLPAPSGPGRPPRLDRAAAALRSQYPMLLGCLRAEKRHLARGLRPERSWPIRESRDEHGHRIVPIVLRAWQQHRQDLGLEPLDPPEAVLIDAVEAALGPQRSHRAPDLALLTARLLAWEWKLPTRTDSRAIRKLIGRAGPYF